MKLLQYFGIGANKILAMDHHVPGIVTHVGRSYLYVVKKPVRLYIHDGNTMFSHFIHFTYTVNGVPYKGRLWVSLRYRCPQKDEQLDVYYDPEKPQNYAFYPFGPNQNPIGW